MQEITRRFSRIAWATVSYLAFKVFSGPSLGDVINQSTLLFLRTRPIGLYGYYKQQQMNKIFISFLLIFMSSFLTTHAESTVYLLVNARPTLPTFTVSVNGANTGTVEIDCPFIKNRFGILPTHKKAIRKCIFKNDGRTVLSYKYENQAGTKDWSDAITLDLQDGETYYIELISGDIKYKIKELTEKEYLKKTKKSADFQVNPDYEKDN